ncbi:MAG: bifunctional protein PutA [Pseudomonadota bacterium]
MSGFLPFLLDRESIVLTDPSVRPNAPGASDLEALHARIFTFDDCDEQTVMAELMPLARLEPRQLAQATALATRLAEGVRKARLEAGGVDLLTQEFTLDSREGVALMCLAEAMLRVPDTETRNKLIRDKIVDQDWRSHIGQSPSLFVNAAAWGLALTGKVLKPADEPSLAAALSTVLRRGGEGVVRAGVSFAMKLLGKQFVTGQTIEEALTLAAGREKLGYRYTYDMLGEAALTLKDADAYHEAYAHTIEAVGRAAQGRGPVLGAGVSVKLTGLHPRYEVAQRERVLAEMYPKLLQLAREARRWGMGFHLDQEEAARFPLTLEMLHRLAHEPDLAGWDGLGISLQAYQKRARAVAEWLIALARRTQRKICVRLVKGAYWDTEIKHCQSTGTAGFPVFTRKVHSDVSYVACAKILFGAQDAVFPQFATHNAFSIAAVHTLGEGKDYEFQCLHGMGESVYDQIVGDGRMGRACRVYAPVGPHETLLAYLVRRLLENGANTSFVNQVVDPAVSIADIVADPVEVAARTGGRPHPAVVLPRRLLGWRDGDGDGAGVAEAAAAVPPGGRPAVALASAMPAAVPAASPDAALTAAVAAGAAWAARPLGARVKVLQALARQLEAGAPTLVDALVHERGITVAEVGRELRAAADGCRLHLASIQAEPAFLDATPVGPVVLLGPATSAVAWPLAQIAAALLTGNPVVFKPASGTVRCARALAAAVREAGLPDGVLQVVEGPGERVGAALARHAQTALVLFGGTRAVAATLRTALAGRRTRLLVRASACNAMVVDSSALPEQVITDAVTGAFDGAGLRVDALKLLCLQDVVADRIGEMLRAMLEERQLGDPSLPARDIGPMPDAAAGEAVERHLQHLAERGCRVVRAGRRLTGHPGGRSGGAWVQPAIVELRGLQDLALIDPDRTGPVLYVLRWSAGALPALLQALDGQLMPATLGLHTRIFETAGEVLSIGRFGAVCVNRGVHGSRPGMQVEARSPADRGASETGPLFLREFLAEAIDGLPFAVGPFRRIALPAGDCLSQYPVVQQGRLQSRAAWQDQQRRERLDRLDRLERLAPLLTGVIDVPRWQALKALATGLAPVSLPALSGEENTLLLEPCGRVLCLAEGRAELLQQAALALACGNRLVLWSGAPAAPALVEALGASAVQVVDRVRAGAAAAPVDAVLAGAAGLPPEAAAWLGMHTRVLYPDAQGRHAWAPLVRERQIAVNASASGGNMQLMMMDAAAV